ncbi:MAG: metal-dependent hydrolase [Nanoarchaeota archaeon]|nr:metal-dependent hydrolase [Nanoarchaeota archaeon]MBU1322090.1 metal-dependent hydrolase [Nanoarchaeota archaeon]MBU1597908.1 metal-dependent hydrolase [Nanoarchaeota archaeon]MBU2442066.1 metal-dependent hydrolase [Nanoarchaeota archaeon]
MMLWTHLSFALVIGLFVIKNISFSGNPITLLAFILLGGFFPDIDCATALVGTPFKFINMFLRHRGFFHSIVSGTAVTIIVFLLTGNSYYALGFLLGFMSHLFLDSTTKRGISFFWPSKIRMRGKLKTGRLPDWLLFFMFVIISVLMWF